MRRFVLLCSLSGVLCFGSCTGCGAAFWYNRVAFFRGSVPIGHRYSLVLRHGIQYLGLPYPNCAALPTEDQGYPMAHRTLGLYYDTATWEYPLVTISLPGC